MPNIRQLIDQVKEQAEQIEDSSSKQEMQILYERIRKANGTLNRSVWPKIRVFCFVLTSNYRFKRLKIKFKSRPSYDSAYYSCRLKYKTPKYEFFKTGPLTEPLKQQT